MVQNSTKFYCIITAITNTCKTMKRQSELKVFKSGAYLRVSWNYFEGDVRYWFKKKFRRR